MSGTKNKHIVVSQTYLAYSPSWWYLKTWWIHTTLATICLRYIYIYIWVVLAVDLALLFHSRRTWDLCSNVLFEYWPIVQTMMLCMMHERRSCDNCFWLWHYWVVTKRHKMCQQTHTSLVVAGDGGGEAWPSQPRIHTCEVMSGARCWFGAPFSFEAHLRSVFERVVRILTDRPNNDAMHDARTKELR